MIRICISTNNINERIYAVKQTFEILGVEYDINIDSKIHDYIIEVGEKKLVVQDNFFSKFPEDRSYLTEDNIPCEIKYESNPYISEKDIPIIYGKNEIIHRLNQIECKIDIFASVFFMLSRWEESVKKKRDNHGRFPAKESLAVKFGFIERPVVNEYCELLWNMLISLGCADKRTKKQGFSIVFSHDVDVFRQSSIREIVKSIYYFKSIAHIINTIKGYLNFDEDVYNTYSFLMDQSERCNMKSHFYFMSDDKNRFFNSKYFMKVIKSIIQRGHYVGFHPGYETYKNPKKWEEQYNRLKTRCGIRIEEGRQHVLQIACPESFLIWESHQMKYDSSLAYAERAGYRCGTSNFFHLFDVKRSKELRLQEMPLIIMDVTLKKYENLTVKEAALKIKYFIKKSEKYDAPITLLFHNSNFYGEEWEGWKKMYCGIGI